MTLKVTDNQYGQLSCNSWAFCFCFLLYFVVVAMDGWETEMGRQRIKRASSRHVAASRVVSWSQSGVSI